jgi:hypothetical protein
MIIPAAAGRFRSVKGELLAVLLARKVDRRCSSKVFILGVASFATSSSAATSGKSNNQNCR